MGPEKGGGEQANAWAALHLQDGSQEYAILSSQNKALRYPLVLPPHAAHSHQNRSVSSLSSGLTSTSRKQAWDSGSFFFATTR